MMELDPWAKPKPKVTYTQVTLRRPTESGHEQKTTWVPSQYAETGKVLKLRESKRSEWDDGWEVVGVGGEIEGRPESVYYQIADHLRSTGDSTLKIRKAHHVPGNPHRETKLPKGRGRS